MSKILLVAKAALVAGVLIYAANYTPTTPAPAAPPASTQNCLSVPTDGQSHPCNIPAPPATEFTVITQGAHQVAGDCWTLVMNRTIPGGSQSLRTCVPKVDYDAHPVGSTYTVGGPGTGLSGGTATRVTDGG
jgi:hypothetical protein